MFDRTTLVEFSNLAWEALETSLAELPEGLAWASIAPQPGEYLHTEGSILSQIAHVASMKFIYASGGFQNSELRWRDLAAKADALWPNLEAIHEWLRESHEYWMRSWSDVDDFSTPRPRFNGEMWPAWKLVAMVVHHDHYHAGQIQLLRSVLAPASAPPPTEGAQWEQCCKDFACW